MNKTLAAATMAVSLTVGGAAGAALFTPGLSSAQEADTPSTTEPADETTDQGDRRGRRGPDFAVLADVLGLSPEEIRTAVVDGSTIAELAEAQGVAVQDVIDALLDEVRAHLDEHVAAGDLTQEEADEKLAGATERITTGVEEGFRQGPRGHRGPGRFLRGIGEDVQDLLGLTGEEIREELADGSTLADIAESQGVSVSDLVDAMMADVEARIAEKVAEGDLTQDEADDKLAELEERLTEGVENGFPERGERGRRGPGRGFGGPQADGDTDADAEETVAS